MFKRKGKASRQSRARAQQPSRRLHEGLPCVTIAVQWGSRGEAVAPRLAARLGLTLYDSEIMTTLGEQSKVPREILSALDEDSTANFSYLVSSLLGSPYVTQDDFGRDLVRVIHQIAEQGNTIIVGRGAAFVLHGPRVLNARIIEPYEQRLRRLMETRHISYTEAEIALAEVDSARSQFVEDHYRRDIEDPEAYDLVLNAQFLDEDVMLDVMARAFEAKRAAP